MKAGETDSEARTADRRVMVYVDGLNLYYGLRSKGWRRFYWLDMQALSADSDLAGPVEAAIGRYTDKRVIAVFPPGRRSDKLRRAASISFTLGRKVLKDSQLPERVVKADGFVLERPQPWR